MSSTRLDVGWKGIGNPAGSYLIWSPQLAFEKSATGRGGLRMTPILWNEIARFAWNKTAISDKYTLPVRVATHRLDGEGEGANRSVGLHINAYWRDTGNVGSKDRRYDF